jgi:hypothetical protein
MSAERTIWLVRGTDKTVRVIVRNTDGSPFDLTDCVGYLTVKLRKEDTTNKVQKATNVSAAGAIVSAAGGTMEFYLLASDSAAWVPDSYVYDVQIVKTVTPAAPPLPAVTKRYSVVSMSRLEVQYDVG